MKDKMMQEKYGLPPAHEFDERELIAHLEHVRLHPLTPWERFKMFIKMKWSR